MAFQTSQTTSTAANILIVEDEFLVALELEDILTVAGHNVVGIVPDEASVETVEHVPQVALVDLNLRDGPSGPQIARRLADRYGTVIIYVTANPSQIGSPAATAIGVVHKPFSERAILAAIAVAMQGTAEHLPRELDLYAQSQA